VKIARCLTALLATCAFSQDAHAQDKGIEISATAGTRFGGSLDVGAEDQADGTAGETGTLSFDTSFSYGGIFGYRVQPNGFAFLSYSRQETTARFRQFPAEGATQVSGDASVEYFQLGGNLEVTRGRLVPYFGLSVGPARFAALGKDGQDSWFFSAVIDAGLKIELTPNIYLRALGRVPFTFQGGDVYCYTGFGCLVALHSSPLVQGELHGGVTVAF
jgi:hypothetical protein